MNSVRSWTRHPDRGINHPTVWDSVIKNPGAGNVDLLAQAIEQGHKRGLKVLMAYILFSLQGHVEQNRMIFCLGSWVSLFSYFLRTFELHLWIYEMSVQDRLRYLDLIWYLWLVAGVFLVWSLLFVPGHHWPDAGQSSILKNCMKGGSSIRLPHSSEGKAKFSRVHCSSVGSSLAKYSVAWFRGCIVAQKCERQLWRVQWSKQI